MEEPKQDSPQFVEKTSDEAALKELTGIMPEVVSDAIAAASAVEQEEKQALEKAQDFLDNKGRKFDPNLHAIDPNTKEPVRTPTGRFKRKLKLPEHTTSLDTKVIDPLMVEAEKYADMFIVGGMGFVGDEFKPTEGEREGLVLSWHAIFAKYGIMPIHPIAGVLVAHSLYIFRRSDKPRTRSILEKAFSGIKFFFINLWYKVQGKDFKVVPKDQEKKSDGK